METKLIAMMIVGIALVLATAATVYTQSAAAVRPPGGNGGHGQAPPGLATACGANPNVQLHNQNCPS